jgi:hypothetical protein
VAVNLRADSVKKLLVLDAHSFEVLHVLELHGTNSDSIIHLAMNDNLMAASVTRTHYQRDIFTCFECDHKESILFTSILADDYWTHLHCKMTDIN